MNAETPSSSATPADSSRLSYWREWEEFWFRPADPIRLGLIRIGTGLVVLMTFATYAFDLQTFLGKQAWLNTETRLDEVRNRPHDLTPLSGSAMKAPPPRTNDETRYFQQYVEQFKEEPPGPYPRNNQENEFCIAFRAIWGVDFRKYGMPIPKSPNEPGASTQQSQEQISYLEEFASRHLRKFGFPDAPAPPYPRDAAERREIFDYLDKYGKDLHRLESRGEPVWSLWFYVTDPAHMRFLHGVVLFTALLFTLGCCTRITAPLIWFFNLNYLFRTPYSLFGVDTMTNIVLFYLMISPCGAALSLDRLIGGWWSRNKLAVVNRWRRFWKKPALGADEIRPSAYRQQPPPSVAANVALRLLQVHLCIIYLIAGFAKLAGPTWLNGTAIWPVIAHPEFAPMQFDYYNDALRLLARHETLFLFCLFIGTYFTLVFEIGYAFLIWTRLRRLYLAGALLMHGMIGVLMGLQTFSIIMVVMNAAFLTDGEAHWLVGLGERLRAFVWKRPAAKTEASLPVPAA